MAGGMNLCITDANGYGLFDYRFMNSWGEGKEIKVWSLLEMIEKVEAAAGSGTINTLYINGHGAPGWQGVGAGQGADFTGERSLQVDANGKLLGVVAWARLPDLGKLMSPDSWIVLSGCQVAAAGKGKALLREVATTLGCWAKAADANQYAWIPGWEGKVYKCSPEGQILCPDGSYM